MISAILPYSCVDIDTVVPLMFACPGFCEFRYPNKTVKLKGGNTDTILTLIGVGLMLNIG